MTGLHNTQKENMLNKCSKQDYCYYFTHFSGPDSQDHQEFIPNF